MLVHGSPRNTGVYGSTHDLILFERAAADGDVQCAYTCAFRKQIEGTLKVTAELG